MTTPPNLVRTAPIGLALLFLPAILLPRAVSAQPVLSVTPSSSAANPITVQANVGTNAASQTVQVRNAGNRALKWTVVLPQPKPDWLLSISPTSGVNNGTLTVTFATSTKPAGQYDTSFVVQSTTTGTAGSPATVYVRVNIVGSSPPPPPALVANCPANMTVASSDGSPVVVTYTIPTPTGGTPPYTVVTGSPPSGSSFPVGTTTVTVTARDSSQPQKTATCTFTVTVTYSPPPPPPSTSRGPQTTITCPAGAVAIVPGMSIHLAVESNVGATTFCLKPGVHSLDHSIVPKTGNTFVGEYGAILDGTGWNTTDDTLAAFRAHNQDIDDVTIRNLVIRNLRRGIHSFGNSLPNGWTIENNEITANYSALVFASNSTVKNNYIHDNPYSGYMGVFAHNSVIENNEIAYNGWEQKVGQSDNVTFLNNFVHHNFGAGIWFDFDNRGGIVVGNRVEDNGWIGIFYEISTDGDIHSNTIRRNGEAGVFLGTSKNTEIHHNTLENNFRGITYFINCPSIGGGTIGWDLANNSSYDNTITVGTQSGAFASLFSYAGACTTTQVAPYLNGSKNLTFSHNTYHVPSPDTGQYWFWAAPKYWNEWQAIPQDATGTVSQ